VTKREKAIIARAVRLIWQENDEGTGFEQGIRLLLPLCGLRIPALELIDGAKAVDVCEIMKRSPDPVDLTEPLDTLTP